MDRLKHMPKIYASPLKEAAYLSHMIDKEWQDFIGRLLPYKIGSIISKLEKPSLHLGIPMAGVQEVTAVLVENRGRSVSWILEMWAPAGIWLPKTTATSSPKLTASRNQEAESHTS